MYSAMRWLRNGSGDIIPWLLQLLLLADLHILSVILIDDFVFVLVTCSFSLYDLHFCTVRDTIIYMSFDLFIE